MTLSLFLCLLKKNSKKIDTAKKALQIRFLDNLKVTL